MKGGVHIHWVEEDPNEAGLWGKVRKSTLDMLGFRGILGIQVETYIQLCASSSEKYSRSEL